MSVAQDSRIARNWLGSLQNALVAGDIDAALVLFGETCFWRDLVSFTWNIETMEGRVQIARMLEAQLPHLGKAVLSIDGPAERVDGMIEAWFHLETGTTRGRGHLRLKDGLGYTLLTTITELKGHEERAGPTREIGTVHGAFRFRRTWHDLKVQEQAELGHDRQPYVVVIGGGQGGIALGARLKRLGVPAIILEKNERAGDSWRSRYSSLVLHDPVWYDHLPYIPFPAHWPVFTPKDMLGDWLEMYVRVMGLNYWTSSTCAKASYNAVRREWTVDVLRDGTTVTLKPKHLVFATGSYGPPREIDLKGAETFTGVQYHSCSHKSAAPFCGKKCVVIGANSSAHDICADFWEHDADVTMVQRSPTTVVRSETLMEIAFAALYSEQALEQGMTTEKADLVFASTPFRLMPQGQIPIYARIAERDADLVARLNAAGFRTDYAEDGAGLMMKALRSGAGYYIDVGASELVADGRVKVRSGVEPVEIRPSSVVLSDGSELAADVIVYATGYRPMNAWVADIVSQEVADQIGPNWGFGSGMKGDPGPWEGELRNMWKPLRHEALWLHGGNLHLSRHYSLYVALQLKARMEGLPTPVFANRN